jgi:uncharacterized membrane protein
MLARARLLTALALALALVVAACGSDDGGAPTGSTCPDGSTLTYESFGAQFMDDYCTRCHSSELTGEDRNGAPLNHDFDTLAGVLAVADHIDEEAAAGPDSVNTAMPPRAPKPTEEERRQLGEWLACEVARQ